MLTALFGLRGQILSMNNICLAFQEIKTDGNRERQCKVRMLRG